MVYLSARDLAARFAVSPKTIWVWTHDGMLPEPVHLGPQVTRWRIDSIEAFERERAAIKDNPQTKRAERAGAVSVRKRAEKKAKAECAEAAS